VIENSELAGLPHTVNLPLEEIPAPGEPGFSLGEYARALRQRKAEPQAIVAVRHLAAPAEEAQAPVREPQARLTETRAHFTELQARVTDTHVCFDQRPVAAPAPVMERSIIRVESGDSLWKLARVHMGDGHLWRLLWRANPEISNPNRIIAGQMLRRPSDVAIAAYRRRHLEPRRDVAQASWGAPQAGK
jgi:nucleoid-associated protein YgaU